MVCCAIAGRYGNRQKLGERPVTGATDSSLEPFKMLLVDWSIGQRLYYVILTGLLGIVITPTRDTHLATVMMGKDRGIFRCSLKMVLNKVPF